MADGEDEEDAAFEDAWIAGLGRENPELQGLAQRITALENKIGEEGTEDSDSPTPTASEQAAAAEILTRRVADEELLALEDGAGALDLGIAAWARREGLSVDEVKAALVSDYSWDLLDQVLEAGFREVGLAAWLDEPEGRGGRPMSPREVGLATAGPGDPDGGAAESSESMLGRALRSAGKWWQRK